MTSAHSWVSMSSIIETLALVCPILTFEALHDGFEGAPAHAPANTDEVECHASLVDAVFENINWNLGPSPDNFIEDSLAPFFQ